jgi:polygalacturonase
MKKSYLLSLPAIYVFFMILVIRCTPEDRQEALIADANEQDHWTMAKTIRSRIVEPSFRDETFLITDFGAEGDSITDCLPALNDAIMEINKAGGGTIVFPAGTYFLNGPIHLKSNIHLHLREGAVLRFTEETDRYLPMVLTRWEGTELYNYSPLIFTYQATNVAITGAGTIDGNSTKGFATWKPNQKAAQRLLRQMGNDGVPVHERLFGKGHYLRPSMIQFLGCKNVLIDGVTILDAPFWVIHPVYSKNVIIRNVTVDSWNKNNDGCDPDASVDVLIENCVFKTGDDGIAIKSGRDQDGWRVGQPTENILIRNCRIGAIANGICIGSEMSGGVRNVFAENCRVDSALSTLYIKSNLDRGGIVENIYLRNIEVDRAKGAFLRLETNYKGHRGNHYPPIFRNFVLEDITCNEANVGIFAEGHPEAPLLNIALRDISIGSATTPYYIRHFETFSMEDVSIDGVSVPEAPEKNMTKPASLEMGW